MWFERETTFTVFPTGSAPEGVAYVIQFRHSTGFRGCINEPSESPEVDITGIYTDTQDQIQIPEERWIEYGFTHDVLDLVTDACVDAAVEALSHDHDFLDSCRCKGDR